MSTLTDNLTVEDCDEHLSYWQRKRSEATEQRDRDYCDGRIDAWLAERLKIMRQPCGSA